MKKLIKIEGMSCIKCVAHVKKALEELKDVSSVEVNLKDKNAIVECNVSDEELTSAIDDAGYDVEGIEII